MASNWGKMQTYLKEVQVGSTPHPVVQWKMKVSFGTPEPKKGRKILVLNLSFLRKLASHFFPLKKPPKK